ncbi:MAG: DUF4065 domain-containing protein [Planctomycetia bacterium]|nr:DUF4065 domain-containing protein [Planctomycetia bacterium]
MFDIFTIANWFLAQEPMTHKKLQKLCYYAQAWYAVFFSGERLFKEDIQAWVHGPAIPEVYYRYSDYGFALIPKCNTVPNFPEDIYNLLTSVWTTYGALSADELEYLTHHESPWKDARQGLEPDVISNIVIPIEAMQSYYTEKYLQEHSHG